MTDLVAEEKLVIGAVLRDNAAYHGLSLEPRHFYTPEHRGVWKAISKLIDNGHEANKATVSAEGVKASTVSEYDIVDAANTEMYAFKLRERVRKADVLVALEDAKREATSDGIIDRATTELLRINNEARTGLVRASSLARETIDRLESLYKNGEDSLGLASGIAELDERTGGFRPAELCILAARTSIGKTALALNMAEHMSRSARVAFFSCEMSKEEIMDRLISSISGLQHQRIRKGTMTEMDFYKLGDAASTIYDSTLDICDTPNIRFTDLRNQARAFCMRGGQVIFVDYLTLVRYGDAAMKRHEKVGQLSADLKELARELKVPIIALSQLNREAERGSPGLDNISQSDEIGMNADMVMILHRERDSDDAVLNITKHRNGPTGKIPLRWRSDTLRFHGVDNSR